MIQRSRTTAVLLAALLLAPPLAAQSPLQIGRPVAGEIADADPAAQDGSRYDEYPIQLTRGQALIVMLKSTAFDAFLALGRREGGAFQALAADDDGSGGRDARLMWTVPADGAYLLRAGTGGRDQRGAYTVVVERESSPDDMPAPTPIRAGETLSGELDHADPQADDNIHFDAYAFHAAAGEIWRVVLRSEAFDAQLLLAKASGMSWIVMWGDDDGAGGTDSLVDARITEAGEYVVVARSVAPDAVGPYTITLEPQGGAR